MTGESVLDLVQTLEREGARLWEESGRLRFRAPNGVMTQRRRAELGAARQAVLEYLREREEAGRLRPDPLHRYDPFPLTDVQSAYLLGRRDAFAYGGVACHGYGELALPDVDPARVEAAWRTLIDRHDMLRAVVADDGTQRILPEVPAYRMAVLDLRDADAERVAAAVDETRAALSHRVYDPGTWPLFELRLNRTAAGLTLHLSIDFLIADLVSTQLLFTELHRLATEPDRPLPPLEVTFRDYLVADAASQQGPAYERDKAYWAERLEGLPPAPELPSLEAAAGPVRFHRHRTELDPAAWTGLRDRAGRHGITPSVAVLTAYAEVVARWSRRPRFTLDLTLQNRQPVHPQVNQIVGDFTSVGLLAVDAAGGPLCERAAALQSRLWADLDHRRYSGLRIARDLARRRGPGGGLFPIVFTSAIGVAGGEADGLRLADMGYGITQTPQVWIDCQALEASDRLVVNWDVRGGVFPAGVVEDMFAAFAELLDELSAGDDAWTSVDTVALPAAQARRRQAVNATATPVSDALLHEGIVARALAAPDRTAVVAADGTLSYGELLGRAAAVARALDDAGCRPGDVVAVAMDKSWAQVVAVVGVLLAGGVYLPLDAGQPPVRRDQILIDAGVRVVLVRTVGAGGGPASAELPETVRVIAVDEQEPVAVGAAPSRRADPDDLAYVIYTSGSTGVPKGVMISHRGAINTIDDITRRFGVTSADRVLGLASLAFDLSVYDIFGVLAAGGRLILPEHARRQDPSHWSALVAEHGVTLWNSVPAQLQMLHDYLRTGATAAVALSSLRLAMLSGDWIALPLPDRIRDQLPGVSLVSLGGATEASIWSIVYPIDDVDPSWPSIPYGKPLANQTWHVLDPSLRPCPDLVVGELFIGGIGLAIGYLGDREKTAARFIDHPVTGERLYRTGDLGRYLPDGVLELLGREDRQVKIRGYRIELAEIEHVLGGHPAVGAAAVVVDGDESLRRRLVAFVEPARSEVSEVDSSVIPDAVVADAEAALTNAVAGLDRDRHDAYRCQLDQMTLRMMHRALVELGVFAGESPAQAQILAPVAPRQRRLVRRWLHVLGEHGLVALDGEGRYHCPPAGDAPSEPWHQIEALATGVEEPEVVAYFRDSLGRLPDLLRGTEDPLPLLFPDGRLDRAAAVFGGSTLTRAANRAVAAAVAAIGSPDGRPLRVLEVGAGTGSTTAAVLDAVAGREVEYLFSDVSPLFLTEARKRFADRRGLRFGQFDLDGDHRDQGLAPHGFDVVVAADVLHAAVDITGALRRLTELLVPGGWLVGVEPTRDHLPVLASLELLARFDERTDDFGDRRRDRDVTFLSAAEWDAELAVAGADAVAWPGRDNALLAGSGLAVFVARVKTDRAALDPAELSAYLAERLPGHMIPALIQPVDGLPLTNNAKVDHSRLRSWVPRSEPAGAELPTAAPSGDLERRLAQLWAEALGVDAVSRDRTFLDLGGDSLVAARLAGRLREGVPEAAGLYFDDLLRLILEGPTVAQLAVSLSAPTAGPTSAAAESSGAVTLQRLGGRGAPAYVLVDDGSGLVGRYAAPLATAGAVLSVAGATAGATAGDEWVKAITAAELDGVHVVGIGPAGSFAMTVARGLAGSGVTVTGLTVIGGEAGPDRAEVYAGDVTLVWPSGRPGAEAALAGWREVCLGDVVLVEVADDAEVAAAVLAGTGR